MLACAGALRLTTEFGLLDVSPGEVAVVGRGMRFSVALHEGVGAARGYVLEAFAGHFTLPELGPIGEGAGGAGQRACVRCPA